MPILLENASLTDAGARPIRRRAAAEGTPGTAPLGTARVERATLALALEHLPLRILSLPILGNSLAPPATTRALRRAAVRCLTTLLGTDGAAEALLLEHDADAQGDDLWAAVLRGLETMSLEGQRRGHGQAAGQVNGRGLGRRPACKCSPWRPCPLPHR